MPDNEIIKFGFARSYRHHPSAKKANNSVISFTKCITSQSFINHIVTPVNPNSTKK